MSKTQRVVCLLNVALILIGSGCISVFAQSSIFSYQGKLSDGGQAANGQYDLSFKLFTLLSGGSQVGSEITKDNVPVTDGVFTVTLDFGLSPFTSNTGNFLEIGVRPGISTGVYTTLSPRQQVGSSPYSVQTIRAAAADSLSAVCNPCVTNSQIVSLDGTKVTGSVTSATNAGTATNSTQLGGVTANQFVQTNDARLSDARPPTANSTNYIQNTNSTQASSNFNISGNGTAGGTLNGAVVNAGTQYNVGGGDRILSGSFQSGNVFVGVQAGNVNSTGTTNTFTGNASGLNNTSGSSNAFFGYSAGLGNNTGSANSFFGFNAGRGNYNSNNNSYFGSGAGYNRLGSNNSIFGSGSLISGFIPGDFNSFFGFRAGENTTGNLNAFMGTSSGLNNVDGSNNTFVGSNAGQTNVDGNNNTFVGDRAGENNTSGSRNVFVGAGAGQITVSGEYNTAIGVGAAVSNNNLSYASAFGAGSVVSQSNSLVLGNGAINVGIGTTAPQNKLQIVDPSNTGLRVQTNTAGGNVASFGGNGKFQIDAPGTAGGRMTVAENGNLGIGTNTPAARLDVAGGSIYVRTPNTLIITSPNGACWGITVSNAGVVSAFSATCP